MKNDHELNSHIPHLEFEGKLPVVVSAPPLVYLLPKSITDSTTVLESFIELAVGVYFWHSTDGFDFEFFDPTEGGNFYVFFREKEGKIVIILTCSLNTRVVSLAKFMNILKNLDKEIIETTLDGVNITRKEIDPYFI